MKRLFYLILCFGIYLIGCETEADISFVDETFQPFLVAFTTEAELRSVSIDVEALTIQLVDDLPTNTKGQCLHYQSGRKEIRISNSYWLTANNNEKELLLFHELGHCLLDRSHNDQVDLLGRCKSIMRSNGDLCDLEYDNEGRNNYLDELFSGE